MHEVTVLHPGIVATGVTLVIATVLVHGVGTHALIRFLVRRHSDSDGMIRARNSLRVVIWTAIVLMALHVVEIHLWALTYMLVLPGDPLDTYEKAVYFSFVTFTTLGYGDVTLSTHDWRILSGVEAMNGILLAGWSTALLFVVVQRSWRNVGRDEAER
jgi:voltage-gated potassium channel